MATPTEEPWTSGRGRAPTSKKGAPDGHQGRTAWEFGACSEDEAFAKKDSGSRYFRYLTKIKGGLKTDLAGTEHLAEMNPKPTLLDEDYPGCRIAPLLITNWFREAAAVVEHLDSDPDHLRLAVNKRLNDLVEHGLQ